jgi:tetratricopeptide (TPR) repeat protein
MTDTVNIPAGTLIDAARALSTAGRWDHAAALLDTALQALPPDATARPAAARIALAAAHVAVESSWFTGADAAARLSKVDEHALDPVGRWDLDFLWLRYEYRERMGRPDRAVRSTAERLVASAPDPVRRGWAHFYSGAILDNLFDDRASAPAHYELARAGAGPDDLLRREALRHLGDHSHDAGEHETALRQWREATTAGARAGNVPGTLSQQLLLAVLARDAGDEAGATLLAGEVARWAEALGARRTAEQADAFVDGADPTKPPTDPGRTGDGR